MSWKKMVRIDLTILTLNIDLGNTLSQLFYFQNTSFNTDNTNDKYII